MKFLVDVMPNLCKDCPYCAPALVMTQLGVQKEADICTLRMALFPPIDPGQEPPLVEKDKTPEENECICTASDGKRESGIISGAKTQTTENKKSSILLS